MRSITIASVETAIQRKIIALLTFVWLCLLPCMSAGQTSLARKWVNNSIIGVEALSVSPEGQLVAVGGFGGVQIYRRATNQLLLCIPPEQNGFVTSVAFSPNGSVIAIGQFIWAPNVGYAGSVELRNTATGELIKQLPTAATFAIDSLAFTPDGRTLVDGGRAYDRTTQLRGPVLELWSLDGGFRRKTLASTSDPRSIAISKDGNMLVVGGDNAAGGSLELWSLKSGKLIERFPTSAGLEVTSVAITPDQKTIVDGGYSGDGNWTGVVEEWSVASGKLLNTPNTSVSQVSSVAISTDGKTYIDAGFSNINGVLELRSISSGALIASVSTDVIELNALAFTPDGKELLGGGSRATLETRSSSSLALTSTISTGQFQLCRDVRFSPDGRTLAAASYNFGGFVGLWNTQTGQVNASLKSSAYQVSSVAFCSDNKTLASCGQTKQPTGVLELWNYRTRTLIANLATTAKSLSSIQFSPDGKTLADGGYGANGGLVEIWDASKRALTKSLPTAAHSIMSVAFSPDGAVLADGGIAWSPISGANTGVVELWNVATGKLIATYATAATQVSEMAFSPNGKLLLVGGTLQPSNGAAYSLVLEVWRVTDGSLAGSLSLSLHSQYLYASKFSTDGKTILVGTDQDMEAFSTSTFSKIATCFQGAIISVDTSSKDNLIAVSSGNHWLGIFHLGVGKGP